MLSPSGGAQLPFLESAERTVALVSTVRLDTYYEKYEVAPDVINIDVEGAEGIVLRGAPAILRRSRPVLVVSMYP